MKARHILQIAATAVLLALAFPNASFWPLAYVGLIPLMLFSRKRSWKQAFFAGTAAGLLFYGITFSWFASLTYWVGSIALLGVGLLLLLFACFWGAVWVGKKYIEETMPAALAIFFPALWILMEYVENHIFTGFGWGSLGYTQWNNLPVAQLASVGSIYSTGFFVVVVNVLIYQVIVNARSLKRLLIPAAAAILVIGGVWLWGAHQTDQPDMTSPLRVGVIQPNFSLDVKWSEEYAVHMLKVQKRMTDQLAAEGAQLIIWPESALYGFLVNEIDRVGRIVRENNIHLLMGSNHYERVVIRGEEDILYYNSAFLLDPEGRILGRYDKRHLAPFGEYVPMANVIGFVGKVVPAISDFSAGSEITHFEVGGRKFAVLICFENSFPHVVRESAQGVDFLVQITNDGWFGRSAQPRQDLAIAVFRAIENGMTLARGTNTGISCFIDPWGKVSGIVHNAWGEEVFARGISEEPISTVSHPTLYNRYGDLFVMVCLGLVVLAGGIGFYRGRFSGMRAARQKDSDVEEGRTAAVVTAKGKSSKR
ncbi:MAG: apolipoprotein N-acyltransferase [Candidatus Abyssobacteria bacterium SURF_5]|uniref:Apolipoprotein N-acyltransferase n=1 Tax=Abyssobacteria bacterium (strain SURF_5) TaxID=2093360 RepID=A0A3A4NUG1_ABYX5|nr:MAG: apolipoprotein N-acyltransferase [Candidatus Abyssubacteria bacterium SURF_5]